MRLTINLATTPYESPYQRTLRRNREWRRRNPEKYREMSLRNYNRRKAVWNHNQIFYRYGITRQQYEQMIIAQDNKCAICGREFGDTKETKPHIDHCHKTGTVRKLLCSVCNRGLGQFKDDPELLVKAAEYLRTFLMSNISSTKETWRETVERYIQEGITISGGCGASSQQKQIEQQQQQLLTQMTTQAKDVFGDSSQVFSDLVNAYSPIVAAGPNQQGFSPAEDSALKSEAITNTGQAYKNASQAVKEADAAVGGGNTYLPGGAEIGRNVEVANEGAAQTASALNKIDLANYQTGRENYFEAAKGLAGTPDVFNPATSAANASVNAGEAAANTANQIAQENNSWVSAVTGALGGVAGDVVTGGMKNLGEGVGFFGQNAPA